MILKMDRKKIAKIIVDQLKTNKKNIELLVNNSINEVGYFYLDDLLPKDFAIQLMKITIALMFAKYSISQVLSLNDRPFLFTENNFELVIPLSLLFCYRNKSLGLTILLLLVILIIGEKVLEVWQ